MHRDSRNGLDDLYFLMRDLFLAGAATSFLWAMHRVAVGMKMQARMQALQQMPDAFTPEERELLIHKIKERSLSL